MHGAASDAEVPPGGSPPTPPVANGGDGPDRGKAEKVAAEPAPTGRKYPGSGVRRFIGESVAELKKVEWPTQSQLVTGTTVVLIACIIVGFYLYANDQIWKYVVQKIFLR